MPSKIETDWVSITIGCVIVLLVFVILGMSVGHGSRRRPSSSAKNNNKRPSSSANNNNQRPSTYANNNNQRPSTYANNNNQRPSTYVNSNIQRPSPYVNNNNQRPSTYAINNNQRPPSNPTGTASAPWQMASNLGPTPTPVSAPAVVNQTSSIQTMPQVNQ